MIALYFHAQLWFMKDTDVLCLHFAVNYRHLMCQSKHILDMLGSSEKCNYIVCLVTLECIWWCSADEIVVHNITKC